jgi:hypothetical protein
VSWLAYITSIGAAEALVAAAVIAAASVKRMRRPARMVVEVLFAWFPRRIVRHAIFQNRYRQLPRFR